MDKEKLKKLRANLTEKLKDGLWEIHRVKKQDKARHTHAYYDIFYLVYNEKDTIENHWFVGFYVFNCISQCHSIYLFSLKNNFRSIQLLPLFCFTFFGKFISNSLF